MGEGSGGLTREGSAVFGEVSISSEGTLTGGGLPSSLSLLHEKVSPLSAWCVVTDYFENSSLLFIALVGMGLNYNRIMTKKEEILHLGVSQLFANMLCILSKHDLLLFWKLSLILFIVSKCDHIK